MKNNKRINTSKRIIAAFFALIMFAFASGCGQELDERAEYEKNITNNSPTITIELTETHEEPTAAPEEPAETPEPFHFEDYNLILNNNSHLFHQNNCEAVYEISPKNREGYNGTPEEARALGYEPCHLCSSEWETTPEPEITTTEEPYVFNTYTIKSQILIKPAATPEPEIVTVGATYILNTNTYKFHYPTCSSVNQMADKNKLVYTGSRSDVISMGYVPCKNCNP